MNDTIFIAVASATLVALMIMTIFMVRHYAKPRKVDPTTARHLKFHQELIVQANELGLTLTGKETSSEVSSMIGTENRRRILNDLEVSPQPAVH